MSNTKLNIGLFGFGVVGEGIYTVLQETPTLDAQIKKVCIKHPEKKRNAPQHLFTTDANELLQEEDINVIVELIDDAEAAYEIVCTALRNGKHVVSANKKMVAHHLDELIHLCRLHGVSLLYEAAVGGSIPIIRNLEEYYNNDLLCSLSGILNGSTNFILTKMKEEQVGYTEALQQAQQLGFAESNPILDVAGIDAVNKLSILLRHSYGLDAKPQDLIHYGIDRLQADDLTYAREKGLNVKLVAHASQDEQGKVTAYVLPQLVKADSHLYHIRNEYNGVLLSSKLSDEQFLYGKGAGRFPTASAVLSDIAALQYDYKYEYKKSGRPHNTSLCKEQVIEVYVSYPVEETLDQSTFETINEWHRSTERCYVVGSISLAQLERSSWFTDERYSLLHCSN